MVLAQCARSLWLLASVVLQDQPLHQEHSTPASVMVMWLDVSSFSLPQVVPNAGEYFQAFTSVVCFGMALHFPALVRSHYQSHILPLSAILSS